MERSAAIAELPLPYAVALGLHESGAPPHVIARALRIDPAGVPMVLRIARDKLVVLLAQPEPPS